MYIWKTWADPPTTVYHFQPSFVQQAVSETKNNNQF